MPYTITTKDGITINNIPDDVPPDSPELKQRVAEIRAKGGAQALDQPETTASGILGGIVRGAGPIATGAALGGAAGLPFAGVGAVPGAAMGAAAMGTAMLVADPLTAGVNAMLGTKYRMPTEALQDFLTRIGVPESDTEAERIVQAVASGGAGAGGGIGLGQALMRSASPVAQRVGAQMAGQVPQQVIGGMGAGAAAQTAQELGGGPLAQFGAGIAGGMGGAALGGLRAVPRGAMPQDLATAERFGVPVLTSDVAPPRTFMGRSAQVIGERIPFAGTGPVRQQQQEARIGAIRDVLRQFGADAEATATDDVMAELLKKRSADFTKYTDMKGEVIQRLGQSGGPVDVTRTQAAIDAQIARLEGLKSVEYKPVIAKLQDWRTSIEGQNLDNIELLRKQLGEAFVDPSLAAVRSTGEKAVSSIYAPLREDMRDFIRANGDPRDITKFEVANKRLQEMAGELKNQTLASVLRRGEATPEIVRQMLFSNKKSDVQRLYRGLTQEGQARARAAILQEAVAKAGGLENVSPQKFTSEVARLGRQVGVFFDGQDLQAVNGLSRVLDLTRRAGEAGVMTKTGQELYPAIGFGALTQMLGGVPEAMLAGAAAGGVARGYESAAVRNILMKIPQTVRGSKEELQLIKRLAAATGQISFEEQD